MTKSSPSTEPDIKTVQYVIIDSNVNAIQMSSPLRLVCTQSHLLSNELFACTLTLFFSRHLWRRLGNCDTEAGIGCKIDVEFIVRPALVRLQLF